LQAIRQHHELIDGTGFPHGLADDRICLAARIIGLTQAYLSLTSPLDGREGFVPADSVAYLLYHSLKGRFCLKVMQALVHVISVYPQGSTVRLADQRTGTVVRCAANDPMRPVIRLDGEICDLGQSPNRIVEPTPGPAALQKRLPTRFLKEILW
jgi:HD-GYP domain-containing protein (c-di-GMP phosphodiesterase class II)